jgi:hypothetical protein
MAAGSPDDSGGTRSAGLAQECGLASMLLGGFLVLAAALGFILNALVAVHGRSILTPFQVRLHALATATVVTLMFWAVRVGMRLSFAAAGRTPGAGSPSALAGAGFVLNVLAGTLWLLFAFNAAFVVAGLW